MNEQRDKLELVANQLALQILRSSNLKAKPEQFKIFLSHDILSTSVMKSGDPVQIYLRELDMVEALVIGGIRVSEFRDTISSCLRNVPRLHPATCLIVPPKIIKREEGKWLVHKESEADLFPNLIPEESISYTVRLYVQATCNGRKLNFVTRNLDVSKMRRDVRELFSEKKDGL